MPTRTLKISGAIRQFIRELHPTLKRKIRSGLADILSDPTCGKPLKMKLEGYWSLRMGRHRIIYRPDDAGVEVVAIGPRSAVYEDAVLQVVRNRDKI